MPKSGYQSQKGPVFSPGCISNKIMMNWKIWIEQWYFCEVSKRNNAPVHNNLCHKIHGKVLKGNALCRKIQFLCPSNYKHYVAIIYVHNNLCLKVQHWKIIVKHSGQQKHRQTHVTLLQYNWFKFSSLQTLTLKKITNYSTLLCSNVILLTLNRNN